VERNHTVLLLYVYGYILSITVYILFLSVFMGGFNRFLYSLKMNVIVQRGQ
jgi:hypothetical protein